MKKNIDAIQTMARVVDDALDDGDIKFALEFIGHIQSALNGLEKMIVKK